MSNNMDRPINKESIAHSIEKYNFNDFKWIDPKEIVVAHWVRMKCTFGCPNYGRAVCPPNNPSVEECRLFFDEYTSAIIIHHQAKLEHPDQETNSEWSRDLHERQLALEREVFLSGQERAFILLMVPCSLCEKCVKTRLACKHLQKSRPTPECMGVDVYSTARKFGFEIEVRTTYDQAMDRFAILLVR